VDPVQETTIGAVCLVSHIGYSLEKYLALSFIILSRNSSISLNGGIASYGNEITKALSEAAKIIE
jgi:hypothetical protein